MESKSSTDSSGINIKMLKFVKYQIAKPLSHLFSLSISTGVFQAKLKLSKTIPIFKAGDHACCDNYRQISLLSSISKVFEKIVANTFVNHLEINKLLCDNQYGFLRERSTVHNITKLTRKISHDLKGIVSRDWGGLQMILLDRLEVFIISASGFYLFLSTFSYRIF